MTFFLGDGLHEENGAGKWLNVSAYVSIIKRLVVCPRSVLLALMIHLLSADHQLAPTSSTNWFTKVCVMSYHVHVIVHVKYP